MCFHTFYIIQFMDVYLYVLYHTVHGCVFANTYEKCQIRQFNCVPFSFDCLFLVVVINSRTTEE